MIEVISFFPIVYFVFALYKPRLAVLLLPLFFPAYLLNFKLAGIPFTLIEALIYVTFLASFRPQRSEGPSHQVPEGLSIWHIMMNKFFVHKDMAHGKIWIPIGLLFLAAVISTLIVPKEMLLIDGKTLFESQKIALGILKGWIVAPFLMFALFAFFLREERDFRHLLDFYVVSSLILAFWALYQVMTHQYITADMRASGPFISANYLALYITPAAMYAFIRFKTFAWKLAFILLFLALLFTKSYAAIMALFVAVFGYLCLWYFRSAEDGEQGKTKKVLWKLAPLCVMFWVVIFALVISFDPVKWQQFFQFAARSSSAVRLEIYQVAAGLIVEHPFLGLGLGQFPAFYQLEAPRILGHAPYEWNMLHPHNLFLAFWLNMGLIGLAALLWILVLCAQKVWPLLKIFYKQAVDSFVWIKVIGFFMLFIIIFHGFFDTPFFKPDLALLFWLVVGVILLPISQPNAENTKNNN